MNIHARDIAAALEIAALHRDDVAKGLTVPMVDAVHLPSGPAVIDYVTETIYPFATLEMARLAVSMWADVKPALLGDSFTRGPVDEVLEAWNDPGPVPKVHNRAKRKLRRDWPALAGALDLLTAATYNDPEPR